MNRQKYILILIASAILAITIPCHAETVLDRVVKVEDSELNDCIQLALKNLPIPDRLDPNQYTPEGEGYTNAKRQYEKDQLQVTRTVTELYAQIKLLDSQIKHLDQQLTNDKNPTPLRYELILAKAELESQRMRTFAQLREAMHILPNHAGKVLPGQILSWIVLDVITKDSVLIFNRVGDLKTNQNPEEYKTIFECRATPEKVRTYIDSLIKKEGYSPMKVEILRSYGESIEASGKLYKSLSAYANQENKQNTLDIKLNAVIRDYSMGGNNLFIAGGLIGDNAIWTNQSITKVHDQCIVNIDSFIEKLFQPNLRHFPRILWICHHTNENDKKLAETTQQQIESYAEKNNYRGFIQIKLIAEEYKNPR